MKFIIDENTGPSVARWLTSIGHDVISIYDEMPGISDEEILEKANAEDRIVITTDKDFGELVFKNKMPHKGIILMRLVNESPGNKIQVLEKLMEMYSDELPGKFVVVTEGGVRIY